MNKKQLGAFLKIVSKDSSRAVLTCAYVDEYNGKPVLVATDSYKLTAVYIDGEVDEEIKGRLIRREALERWYKLATGKSRLTADELLTVSRDDYALHGEYMDAKYPDWQAIIEGIKRPKYPEDKKQGDEIEPVFMAFNAEFFKLVQDVNAAEHIKVEIFDILSPMVIRTDVAYSVVMPIKQ